MQLIDHAPEEPVRPDTAPIRGPRQCDRQVELEQENRRLRRQITTLNAALESRADIDRAVGMIMAGARCDAAEAWTRLVAVSNDTNLKVRDICRALTGAGTGGAPLPTRDLADALRRLGRASGGTGGTPGPA
ncbi:ANTAR domain-containing protein [Nocardiopsis mangrovi]|uniref:ANTAR domain-containing protein n=1 Tax=Nocardiopsis mangrovi TaxID=1179818 RepID=A0ABV9DXA1_9ACTN